MSSYCQNHSFITKYKVLTTDDDDAEDCAADADDSALVSVRNEVPVADRGHGDEGPPVGVQHVDHTTSAVSEKYRLSGHSDLSHLSLSAR